MIIAIDGTVASGKSTVAAMLANQLNFLYINTGLMYRSVAAWARLKNIATDNQELIAQMVATISIDLVGSQGQQKVFVNGKNLTNECLLPDIGKFVSNVADNKVVRAKLVQEQQRLGQRVDNAVLEGRDIGSVVFPDADFKFFVTAETKIRALRRLKDDQKNNPNITLTEVEQQLVDRDRRDRDRTEGPLIKVADAILIDTSYDDQNQVVNKMIKIIQAKNE